MHDVEVYMQLNRNYSTNYINISLAVFVSWLSHRTVPCYASSASEYMMQRVNKEIKQVVDYSDKSAPQFLSIEHTIQNKALSIEHVCWFAQSYGMIDQMSEAAKKLSASCLYLLKPMLDEVDYKKLELYTNGEAELSYSALNKARFKARGLEDSVYKRRLTKAVDALINSELYLDKSCIKNAYSILNRCYQDTIDADSALTTHANNAIKDIFKRV